MSRRRVQIVDIPWEGDYHSLLDICQMYKGSLYDKLVIISDVGCKVITGLSFMLILFIRMLLSRCIRYVHWIPLSFINNKPSWHSTINLYKKALIKSLINFYRGVGISLLQYLLDENVNYVKSKSVFGIM